MKQTTLTTAQRLRLAADKAEQVDSLNAEITSLLSGGEFVSTPTGTKVKSKTATSAKLPVARDPVTGKRVMSQETKDKIAASRKQAWADKKAASTATTTATTPATPAAPAKASPPVPTGSITPASSGIAAV